MEGNFCIRNGLSLVPKYPSVAQQRVFRSRMASSVKVYSFRSYDALTMPLLAQWGRLMTCNESSDGFSWSAADATDVGHVRSVDSLAFCLAHVVKVAMRRSNGSSDRMNSGRNFQSRRTTGKSCGRLRCTTLIRPTARIRMATGTRTPNSALSPATDRPKMMAGRTKNMPIR